VEEVVKFKPFPEFINKKSVALVKLADVFSLLPSQQVLEAILIW
jgi:hypothetical protein